MIKRDDTYIHRNLETLVGFHVRNFATSYVSRKLIINFQVNSYQHLKETEIWKLSLSCR